MVGHVHVWGRCTDTQEDRQEKVERFKEACIILQRKEDVSKAPKTSPKLHKRGKQGEGYSYKPMFIYDNSEDKHNTAYELNVFHYPDV